MKTAKPIAIHLDRLKAALDDQGVVLRRHQLLEIASKAFGHDTANETSALASQGLLDPPSAQPVARVDMGEDSILVMRDMQTDLMYGMSEKYLAQVATDRARQFANTPYGGMADIRRASTSDAPTLSERSEAAGPNEWTAIIQHGDGFSGHTWFRESSARKLATEIAAWCVQYWDEAVRADPTLPAATVTLSDLEVIGGYFHAKRDDEHLLIEDQETLDDIIVLLRDGVIENETAPAETGMSDGRFRAYPRTAYPQGVPSEGDYASSHDTLEEAIAACESGADDMRDGAVVDHVSRQYWRKLRGWERQDMPDLANPEDDAVTTFHLNGRPMTDSGLKQELMRIADMIGEGYREGEVDGGWWWKILGERATSEHDCLRCDSPIDEDGYCTDETCPFSDCKQDDDHGFANHPEGDPRR